MKPFYLIYKTTNKLNGKEYIGKHITKNKEDGYIGSGRLLKEDVELLGEENFFTEILHECPNEVVMNELERLYVTPQYVANTETYNLCVGGKGGFSYINQAGLNNKNHHTPEVLYKKSKTFKKRWEENYDDWSKITSENFKKAHKEGVIPYDNFKGKTHSDETKRKMSETSKGMGAGEKNSQYGTVWINNGVVERKIRLGEDVMWLGWHFGRLKKFRTAR